MAWQIPNVWDSCVYSCSSSLTFELPWEYATKQTNKTKSWDTVFLPTRAARKSTKLLNGAVLFNICFAQGLTGLSNNFTTMSLSAHVPLKSKESLPQEFVTTAEEVATQYKAEELSLDFRQHTRTFLSCSKIFFPSYKQNEHNVLTWNCGPNCYLERWMQSFIVLETFFLRNFLTKLFGSKIISECLCCISINIKIPSWWYTISLSWW